MNDKKNHYGRYQIVPNPRTPNTVEMIIEVAEEVGDVFCLPVTNIMCSDPFPLGYLLFKKIGQHIFQLVEVRQGRGPILGQSASTQDVLTHPREDF